MPEHTAQTEREVETLVRSGEIEVGLEFRDTCSAVFFVIFVDDTVTGYIFEADVTGFCVGLEAFSFIVHVSFSFRIALEDAVCAVEVEAADRLAFFGVCPGYGRCRTADR